MRLDGIIWQKSKIKSVPGFLSDEGDFLIFTKYRDGYEDPSKVLFKKQELKTNRMIDKFVGKLKPEEELFRVNKNEITDLNVMKMDPTTVGGKTYYSVYATFKSNGEDYALTHTPNSAEETDKLGAMFQNA